MSKLKDSEIDEIIDNYKKTKSISQTAKLTGFSKGTVNKYVQDMSCKDSRSIHCKNSILQIDKNTKKILKEYYKPSVAAKENNINPACICRCLKKDIATAGGYMWKYKDIK